MIQQEVFDVIVIGGSYAGLAAGMALGRSLKQTLIIDSGAPCNRQTPYSHNFLTQDGIPPAEIARIARQQVENYSTVKFFDGLATHGLKQDGGFAIQTATGEQFQAKKLIFATGIRDLLPAIEGLSECWGISVIHCPYCHGYEVRNETTGILANGDGGLDLAKLISNWTRDLTLYTNGPSTLTPEQTGLLDKHRIGIRQMEIVRLDHVDGQLKNIVFRDGASAVLKALYTHVPFEQHCSIPRNLGCELNGAGYIVTDAMQETSVKGVFACGDNTGRMRSVASSVAMGTMAGAAVNRQLIWEGFYDL